MEQEALKTASQMIKKDFGSLSDLDEELQNTIANVYYKYVLFVREPELRGCKDHLLAQGRSANRPLNDRQLFKKTIEETVHYTESVKALRDLIEMFRQDILPKGNEFDIKLTTEVFLATFKYRIKNASSKPLLWIKAQKLLNRDKVDEIPNLHKQLSYPKDRPATSEIVRCPHCGTKNRMSLSLKADTGKRPVCGSCREQLPR